MTIFHGNCVNCNHNVSNIPCVGCKFFDFPKTNNLPDLSKGSVKHIKEIENRRIELRNHERLLDLILTKVMLEEQLHQVNDTIALLKKG